MIPIRKSLTQPILVSGCERKLLFIVGSVSLWVWIMGLNLPSGFLAIATWIVGKKLAQKLARIDPQFCAVFGRYLLMKQTFYPAYERPDSKESDLKIWKV